MFDPEAMHCLKLLIEETNAYLVISSTWRIHYDTNEKLWTELVRNLNEYNVDQRIIGITPILDKDLGTTERWKEILNWLEINEDKGIDAFVILDDEWDMGVLNHRFVRCQAYKGLTNETRIKAERILRNSFTE